MKKYPPTPELDRINLLKLSLRKTKAALKLQLDPLNKFTPITSYVEELKCEITRLESEIKVS